jgi:phosphoadenosine phosphosulfate reductase
MEGVDKASKLIYFATFVALITINKMPENPKEKLARDYNDTLRGATAREVVQFFTGKYGNKAGFSSSMGAEDQALTEIIASISKDIRIFTLDTGRLFPETYDLIDTTSRRYGVSIDILFPDAMRVETMVKAKGINLFFESVENRKLCCYIRKIEPLKRVLEGLDVWISGLRREQSVTRNDLSLVEWDALHDKIKVNPLLEWTTEDVWSYIREKDIPYNPLHDKGFPSIGCFPCTRAIEPGEDIRAGRWWWEHPENKECGLHKR